jgi:hypothetical protein
MSFSSKLKSLASLLKGDSEKRWRVAELLSKTIHPTAILGEYAKIWREDSQFIKEVAGLPTNNRQWERLFLLEQFAKYATFIEGDFVECGVHSGSSAYFLCKQAKNKYVHLFDSWEGLSTPNINDTNYWSSGDLSSDINFAKQTLSEWTNCHFHKGWIPEVFDGQSIKSVALLHIDVDIHQPTLDTLERFWSAITPGGIVICDDYGFKNCAGAKKAIDSFFNGLRPVISLPTGQALIIK